MVSIEEIVADLAIPHTQRGASGCLISVADAHRVISECQRRGVPILGIEGFHQSGECILPTMDFIADFSTLADLPRGEQCRRSVEAANEYLFRAKSESKMLLQFILQPS